MAVKSSRVNILFKESTALMLADLANKQKKTVSRVAKELVLEALERHEDFVLSDIAKKRDVKKAKRIKHVDAWK